jgi:hypothetical protein
MHDLANSASTPGDVALFFLMAGISPRDYSAVTRFNISERTTTVGQEVVTLLNEVPKPVLCMARPVGPSLEIVTEVMTDPNVLRTRHRYLQLASQGLPGSRGEPGGEQGLVLLESEHGTLIVSAGLLQRFYEQYDIPHTRSENRTDTGGPRHFTAIIRVHGAGWVDLRELDEEATQEGA